MITRTHHLPTHTPFFRPIMPKKRALHLFLKLLFFCSLLLLLTHKTLPNQLFRKTNDKKIVKKVPKGEKKTISRFPTPLTEKNKSTYFFRPFYHRKRKNRKEKRPIRNFLFIYFFFEFFCTLPLLVIIEITTYLFFRNSDFKCPKMPLSALKFHFSKITFSFAVITRTHTPTQTQSVFPTHA